MHINIEGLNKLTVAQKQAFYSLIIEMHISKKLTQ